MNTATPGSLVDDTATEYLEDRVPDKPFLSMEDVAAIGARVQGRPLQAKSIAQYLWRSNDEVTVNGVTRPGRHAADKFPRPDGRQGPAAWWYLHREAEIAAWFERHPRRMKGDGIGGRPRKSA